MSKSDPDWRAVYDVCAEAMEASDADGILELVARRAGDLLPSDRGAALFTMRDGYPWCIRWPHFCDRRIDEFNTYYGRIVPVHYTGTEPVLGPVIWRDYADTEYVTDFQRPLGLECGVGAGFRDTHTETQYVVWVHRGNPAAAYEDGEVTTLRLACRQIERILSLRSEVDAATREPFYDSELGPDAQVLSPREVEVAGLICRRLTMREIALRLKVSPRTVERHALHIYRKLRVDNRKELAKLLLTSSRLEISAS